jgi:hypothetical protein
MLRNVVEVMWPDAGLGTARRNAWAAMAADAKRARQRAEAAALMNAAAAVHEVPTVAAVSPAPVAAVAHA